MLIRTVIIGVLLAGCGCNSGLIFPKGRIIKDGKPISLKPRESLEVTFVPFTEKGPPLDMFPATVSRDGTFQVSGIKQKGILPGKYRIGVQLQQSTLGDKDLFKGAYRPAESPIIREVFSDSEEIVIDVAKPAG